MCAINFATMLCALCGAMRRGSCGAVLCGARFSYTLCFLTLKRGSAETLPEPLPRKGSLIAHSRDFVSKPRWLCYSGLFEWVVVGLITHSRTFVSNSRWGRSSPRQDVLYLYNHLCNYVVRCAVRCVVDRAVRCFAELGSHKPFVLFGLQEHRDPRRVFCA